ncbi:MAG: MarR family winged helix-turn-helix transcriptional regulator [Oscillospiraceae bacterium]|nr:MarR family winged helix-turn-helix transcriptional regulator [Oscillospiraceae bacterium]
MKKTLSECNCLYLRWITSRTIGMYDKYLAPIGITVQQYTILRHISSLSPITVTDLAAILQFERSTISRNIKVLTDKQLVTYTNLKGRAKQLELTEVGEEILSAANIGWDKAQKEFADKLGTERMKQWNELLTCLLEE